MSTFRIATLNIHSFRRPSNFDSNISDLVSILEPLNLDLIAVQEIQSTEKWKIFCERLSLPNFISGQCHLDPFYNGIASRYPIKSYSNQQAGLFCSGGARSLLQCCLGGDHPFIKDRIFAVTHLDYLDEDDRLKQIQEFNPYKQNIDILMGDMNALTRDDYSDKYYQDAVDGVRRKSGWEKPRFDLTKLITDEWNYQDAFKLKNPEVKDEEIVTCRYGTRIDYIYIRPRVDDQWILNECSIIDTKGATDHNAVFAEFTQISK
jgi:endonuclease/exonuclease/phosphatase family metal-dependent hydrolase